METTTEAVYSALIDTTRNISENMDSIKLLLESINTYMQMALLLVVGILLYKFITAFTGV